MSDLKMAELKLAKLEAQVADAGLHFIDAQWIDFYNGGWHGSGLDDHEIYGTLDGTHRLDLGHSMLNDTDVLNFSIVGGENFSFTISGFHPQTFNGTVAPAWDRSHDTLEFDWHDAGVKTFAQANAAVHDQEITNADGIHHDMLLTIDTPNVHGTITFPGLGDYLEAQPGDHWSWHNEIFNTIAV
jgi:hypothetical protein